uniref:Uncharacterized protein n=1 Tax=Scophthalmus maximus TaxID=52904 RepID=A0A8D3E2I1_SCOMX
MPVHAFPACGDGRGPGTVYVPLLFTCHFPSMLGHRKSVVTAVPCQSRGNTKVKVKEWNGGCGPRSRVVFSTNTKVGGSIPDSPDPHAVVSLGKTLNRKSPLTALPCSV